MAGFFGVEEIAGVLEAGVFEVEVFEAGVFESGIVVETFGDGVFDEEIISWDE